MVTGRELPAESLITCPCPWLSPLIGWDGLAKGNIGKVKYIESNIYIYIYIYIYNITWIDFMNMTSVEIWNMVLFFLLINE